MIYHNRWLNYFFGKKIEKVPSQHAQSANFHRSWLNQVAVPKTAWKGATNSQKDVAAC